ncbi:thylakoid lumenal 17.9 kDa protein, chloroplastic-like [Lolium rigidum]|uniref:thylakoid lumenal 17.9 kDa protein, chloroplastic-like n=1 Tax=Lolium rigidum TaxID=89674 RepID=UPI001F5C3948|nr:thylakoid lumenal 17.9 kDa protein, chloroplastic-like [Lolium rigidum]
MNMMTRWALLACSSILGAAEAPSSSATPATTRRALLLFSTSPFTLAAVAAAAQPSSTPYSQSRTLQLGLDTNGKIRTCPSTNPGCVCTNPTVGASSSVASPLIIPDATSADAAAQSLRQAIIKTQKNVVFRVDQQTPHGHYIQAEVDGGFGRDVMEYLVRKDAGVVAYRCIATKVTFIYPFTTAIGDSRGQEQRVAAVAQELGWYAPDISSSIDFDDVST